MDTITKQLSERITSYLVAGGLVNPELANHSAVRDLLIDCRAALDALPVQQARQPLSEKPTFFVGELPADFFDDEPDVRQPLSGEKLRDLAREFKGNTQRRFADHWDEITALIREVEAAHGITGEQP